MATMSTFNVVNFLNLMKKYEEIHQVYLGRNTEMFKNQDK